MDTTKTSIHFNSGSCIVAKLVGGVNNNDQSSYLVVVKYRSLYCPSLNIILDFHLQFYNDTTLLLIASGTIVSNKDDVILTPLI